MHPRMSKNNAARPTGRRPARGRSHQLARVIAIFQVPLGADINIQIVMVMGWEPVSFTSTGMLITADIHVHFDQYAPSFRQLERFSATGSGRFTQCFHRIPSA